LGGIFLELKKKVKKKVIVPNTSTFIKKRIFSLFALLFLVVYTIVLHESLTENRVEVPHQKDPCVLYSNQANDNLKLTLQELIKSAKSSISIAIFSLTDDDIIFLLKKKSQEGIKVTIVHDAVATQNIAFKLGEDVSLAPRRQKGLMHMKIIVIDSETIWFGSSNYTKDSLRSYSNLMIGIHSIPFAEYVEQKIFDMQDRKNKRSFPFYTKMNEESFAFWFLPCGTEPLNLMVSRMNEAKKSIKGAIFTFTHPQVCQALIDAHNRGVAVQIVIDEDSAKNTSSLIFQRLKKSGVPVYISDRDGLLHHKLMIIDNDCIFTGSANWTKAAFSQNDETFCCISDLSQEMQHKLDLLWETTMNESKGTFSKRKKT